MAPKNLARARFLAARRRNREESKHFHVHALDFHEIVFYFAGEKHYFGYDDSRRCVFRLANVQKYPFLAPEDAADMFSKAEMLFRALRRASRERATKKAVVLPAASGQLELPL